MTQQPTPEQRLAAMRERQEFYRKHGCPSAERPWFAYCSEGGMLFFATEAEAREQAEKYIEDWLDDGWDEQVENVLVGKVTEKATQVNRRERPPESELDEDGLDEDGNNWGDFPYCCDYKPRPLAAEGRQP